MAANPLVGGIEHAGVHIALKKIIKLDQEKRQQASSEGSEVSQFGQAVIEGLTVEQLKSWISQNRPCFLLLLIFENTTPEVQRMVKAKIASVKKELKSQKHTGGKLLVEKLNL